MKRVVTLVVLFMGAVVMTHTSADTSGAIRAEEQQANPSGGADSIKSFRIHFSDDALADMKRRIVAMRWPDKEVVTDQSQGVQLATMQKLARCWATEYDWRKVEARLGVGSKHTLCSFYTFSSFGCVSRRRSSSVRVAALSGVSHRPEGRHARRTPSL